MSRRCSGGLALSRRCSAGSFTIVGDLGQASSARAPDSWEEALAEVRSRSGVRVEELTVNYRTPAEVMVLAGAVLAETAPALTPPRSVRESGQPPVVTRAEPEELLEKTIETSIVERGAVGEGKVAIIAPIDLLDALAGRLDVPTAGGHGGLSRGGRPQAPRRPALGTEPRRRTRPRVRLRGACRARSARGRALPRPPRAHVALTRTTKRLHILHAAALPPSLQAAAFMGTSAGAGASAGGDSPATSEG